MDFSDALRQLRRGRRVTYSPSLDWFLYYVPAKVVHVKDPPLSDFEMAGKPVGHSAHIMKRNKDGTHSPWVPIMDDLLENWALINQDDESERLPFTLGDTNG